MVYTGKYTKKYSEALNQEVFILEYKDTHRTSIPYCNCGMCGKPIIRKMYVIQDPETDVEMMYLGYDCVKKI